jgi:hypothetical protein
MSGDKQTQRVGEGSIAVQADGDATVNVGISTEQMRAIVETMAEQLPTYAAMAAAIVEERLNTFENKVIGKFESELKSHRKAFEDPDFQYLLVSAQQTYARSGDDQTCDNLVNLIGERAKRTDRSLLSLSINTAVERAGVLSPQEFACLSYTFFMRSVRHTELLDIAPAAHFLRTHLEPLFSDIPRSSTSYSYLESIGCGKTVSLVMAPWRRVLIHTYPHLFGGEASLDRIAAKHGGDPRFGQSLIDAGFLILQASGNYRLTNISQEDFAKAVSNAGLDSARATEVFSIVEENAPTEEELAKMLEAHGFEASKHFDLVNSTLLKRFEVTAVGMTIGHANLKRISNFDADLSIWLA